MQKIGGFLQALIGLVLTAALAAGLALLFRAMGGGQAAQGYPPPDVTWSPLATQGYPPPLTQPVIETLPAVVMIPTPTSPPVPAPGPTPVVTVVPTSEPPIVPTFAGTGHAPYTVIFRSNQVLRAIVNDDTDERVLLDVHARLALFLADARVGAANWWSPSPDGRQLALVLSNVESLESLKKGESPKYTIYLLDLASGALQLLIEDGIDPVWSPDSSQIAFRSTRTFGLRGMNVTTGTETEVFHPNRTAGDDFRIGSFTWSPNTQRIALVRSFSDTGSGEVWIVDVAGNEDASPLLPMEAQAGNISWSPRGDQILFLSWLGTSVTPPTENNLWVVDVSTGHQRQLTENYAIAGGVPVWSPDGSWIAFTAANLLEGATPAYYLWVVASEAGDIKRLTNDRPDALYPAWVPDSREIVFLKIGAGIWQFDSEAGSARQIYPQDAEFTIVK